MNEDFSEIINKFSDILKDKNINLNEISNSQGGDSNSSPSQNNDEFQLDIDTILKIKEIISKLNESQNSNRNQLLKAIKPYLEPEKREKLNQYIKIASIIEVLDNLNIGTNFFIENKKGYDYILIITLFLLIF